MMISGFFSVSSMKMGFRVFFTSVFFYKINMDEVPKVLMKCAEYGKYTLGIYAIQWLVLENFMRYLLKFGNLDFYTNNFVVTLSMALSLCLFFALVVKALSRDRYISFCFLERI